MKPNTKDNIFLLVIAGTIPLATLGLSSLVRSIDQLIKYEPPEPVKVKAEREEYERKNYEPAIKSALEMGVFIYKKEDGRYYRQELIDHRDPFTGKNVIRKVETRVIWEDGW